MAWGDCDVSCGGGTRQRTRVCRDPDESTISDVYCAGQPQDNEACSEWSCPGKEFVKSQWTNHFMILKIVLHHFDQT